MLIRELRKTPLAKQSKTKENISQQSELYTNSKLMLADAVSKEFRFEFQNKGGYVFE